MGLRSSKYSRVRKIMRCKVRPILTDKESSRSLHAHTDLTLHNYCRLLIREDTGSLLLLSQAIGQSVMCSLTVRKKSTVFVSHYIIQHYVYEYYNISIALLNASRFANKQEKN